ncbi:DUF5615 family PIN-like protein [Halalkalicoccus sp. NIPERK01]|uniref:DUF5615 family PIN-like protein n=1 Tax=Halalkalicoccus sp. NIPERK01 TaxID=3053469 RepID=UPI00256F41BC|nr:hypothetical protein [Halalkalicoccus sp. NIPERK01]
MEDVNHLDRCRRDGLVVLTNDDDFVRLARDRSHAGIVYYERQTLAPKEFLRAIRQIDGFFTPDEMRGHIEWLDGWL